MNNVIDLIEASIIDAYENIGRHILPENKNNDFLKEGKHYYLTHPYLENVDSLTGEIQLCHFLLKKIKDFKKTFIVVCSNSKKNKLGGIKKRIFIYDDKYNYIDELEINTSSYRGVKSEAYCHLIKLGIIDSKAYDYSVTSWSGPGYYNDNNPYCKIIYLDK